MKHIPVAEPDLSGNEAVYVVDAIKNEKRISSSGVYLERFEQYCRDSFSRDYALSCSNGTTALHLALLGLGVGPGDEVIVPALTFSSTASAVIHAGATPVFVDVRKDTWNIDESKLDAVYSSKTKAIIPVDLYGVPAAYTELQEWCHERKILMIEDAAEAHGAQYKTRPTGSFGDVSIFSFYGNKILTTGEGGVCLTDNPDVYERMRVLKNHGMKKAGLYENEVVGYNYRLTNVQAAIGCAQFERFAEFLEKRLTHEALYRGLLKDLPLSYQEYNSDEIKSAPWFFNVLLDKGVERGGVMERLAEKGVETRPVFTPLHVHKAFASYGKDASFPVAEYIGETGISLPSSSLLTEEDIHYIADALKHALV